MSNLALQDKPAAESRFPVDQLVLTPDDIDLSRSPMAGQIDAETYVLGAFNPGMTRLANGNLLLMVRIAEALKEPVRLPFVHLLHGFEQYRIVAVPLRCPRQRRDVLRQTAAPIADAGRQICVRSDSVVELQRARNFVNVGAERVADVCDLVDEAHAC